MKLKSKVDGFLKFGLLSKISTCCLLTSLVAGVTAGDMSALIAAPGKSLSFNIPREGVMNDLNDYFSFVKSRSSSSDNMHGYGIINYSNDRSLVGPENMWFQLEKDSYYTNGKSEWQSQFDDATDNLTLSYEENMSSIIMATSSSQKNTLKCHPARFEYNNKTYSLILNGHSGLFQGPINNREFEFDFFRDSTLHDAEYGDYKWFKRFPSVWNDVDPYSDTVNYSNFPTGEITLNVIMYYLVTEKLSLKDALYRALTAKDFGLIDNINPGINVKTINLFDHITNDEYCFTALVSDGEKVYAFKNWAKNIKNSSYCHDYHIGYIMHDDYTAVTSIGDSSMYHSFKDVGFQQLGKYDLAEFDPNKKFNPETDIFHNFVNAINDDDIGKKDEPLYSEPTIVEETLPTTTEINNELISYNKFVNASGDYSDEFKRSNLVDDDDSTVWASRLDSENEWAYIKLSDDLEHKTVTEVRVRFHDKYFAKRFTVYYNSGEDISNLETWIPLPNGEVTSYNEKNGVYTISGLDHECKYIGIWLYDLNDVVFAIKEIEVIGHKTVADFPDQSLQNKVLSALGKTTLPIFKDELANLKSLNVDGAKIEKWEGISNCVNLEKLSAKFCGLSQFPPMDSLKSLKEVDASFNRLTSLKNFYTAPSLEKLAVRVNNIENIEPNNSAYPSKLIELDISDNSLKDQSGESLGLSGLNTLTKLKVLNITGNKSVTQINDLSSLINLERLIASDLSICNGDALSSLGNLKSIDLSKNSLVDMDFACNLNNLIYLNLEDNDIETISPCLGSQLLYLFHD